MYMFVKKLTVPMLYINKVIDCQKCFRQFSEMHLVKTKELRFLILSCLLILFFWPMSKGNYIIYIYKYFDFDLTTWVTVWQNTM